jgi:hypothetical protein
MPELALYNEQRDTLAGHLDRVRVAELVRGKPSAHTGSMSRRVEPDSDPGSRTRPTARLAPAHAEQRPDRQRGTEPQPRVQLLPCPPVHPDLTTLVVLPVPHNDGAPFPSRSLSFSASTSLIRSPARHSTTISPRSRTPSGLAPAARMTTTISSTAGGSGGVPHPLVAGRAAAAVAMQGRRRPAATGAIHELREFHDVLLRTMIDNASSTVSLAPARGFTRYQRPGVAFAYCCLAQAAAVLGACGGVQPTSRSSLSKPPAVSTATVAFPSERRSGSTPGRARSECPLASTTETPGRSSCLRLAMRALVGAQGSSGRGSSRLSLRVAGRCCPLGTRRGLDPILE